MDCLQLRQSVGPFHYLISEQAKSLVALQELQHEVGALLEFRDIVIETFPNLRTKLANSTPTTMTSHVSNIPIAVRREWEPGVRVRRKLLSKEESRGSSNGKKTGETSGVQDSGFSTEASSKETHSASSTAPPPSASASNTEPDETEDELWNLLDVIHRKGTRLKDELEALQDTMRENKGNQTESSGDFQRVLLHASVDDVRHLRRERDLLMDRVAEMEAELLAGRVQTSRLQDDLENLISAKQDLEEQLRAVMSQSGEVNTRIHDLHLQFVTNKSGSSSPSAEKTCKFNESDLIPSASHRTRKKVSSSSLENLLGNCTPKVKAPDSRKIAAILKEHDPLILQRHLLTTTVQNQVLQQQLSMAAKLEINLVEKLDKAREENEDLKFQLEDRNIELEGTRARVRLFEQLQRPTAAITSPDLIPNLGSVASDNLDRSRSEIITASMKAMSPLPLNLPFDHSSSTESAHDQAEVVRRSDTKKKPSKIPLVKSYAAPKPPGGKHSPAPGARSHSGESPGRPHSAQSVRNKSEGNSLSGSKSNFSLPKSRNTSLSNTRDSLTGKLRSAESLSKLRESPVNNSMTSNRTTKKDSSHKKPAAPVRRANSIRDSQDAKIDSSCAREKFQSPWILSSFNSDSIEQYPDSLDLNASTQPATIETSSSHRYQTANNFLWTTPENGKEYYDSIDSNLESSLYQQNGEEMAECDSLEKRISGNDDEKK
ncbi:uncharacterized protein LOC116174710 isoform X3 [Photinus pyralis]|nr:uncharacterized protein LOC116174710 isoform X3 [Photinus pyralis]XP_031348559.1 uncharacterized protein LOC116174710 isoform X3 [Photinus pyralis]XP_031348567.1 uncharacterized protein LOC116174710 isoform X3 [Photinus pyralis]XP_031348575.1 uncharacterized protein LOC116174710 isoform X3 [Photinus pyralis]